MIWIFWEKITDLPILCFFLDFPAKKHHVHTGLFLRVLFVHLTALRTQRGVYTHLTYLGFGQCAVCFPYRMGKSQLQIPILMES